MAQRKKRLVSENQFNSKFLEKGGNFHGKTNACHCYNFVGSEITIILILINQKKISENCSKKIQTFYRKLVNSRTTYSAQKSCRLFQKILKPLATLFSLSLNLPPQNWVFLSYNKRIIYSR